MAKKSNEVVPITYCPVADDGINKALAENRIAPPVEKDRFNVYSYEDTFLSEGRNSRGTIRLRDRDISLDAGVFFQSNAAVLADLIGDVLGAAQSSTRSLPAADLYCGVGTFALFLKDMFAALDMVEENKAALAIARGNVHGAGIEHFALSCDAWLKAGAKRSGGTKQRAYGFIVADPPRSGLSTGLRAWLSKHGPSVLAYVSCDSATLARDSKELAASAYELSSLTFCDFYPQTARVESLAIFRR